MDDRAAGRPHRILFLCTGNSCRSQMAEGFARALGAGRIEARSAGIAPRGLDPRAVEAMAEVGVDIAGQTSDLLCAADLAWADWFITLCDEAEEACPAAPPGTPRAHWPLPDPARASGRPEEVRAAFRAVRDEIRRRVLVLLWDLGIAGPAP